MYIKFVSEEVIGDELVPTFREVATVQGGYQNPPGPLTHQNAAIYAYGLNNTPEYQGSVYNYGGTYSVGMLAQALTFYLGNSDEDYVALGPLTGPVNTEVLVRDSGVFQANAVFANRRQFDVFLEPADHEWGINPLNVHRRYTQFYTKVWLP